MVRDGFEMGSGGAREVRNARVFAIFRGKSGRMGFEMVRDGFEMGSRWEGRGSRWEESGSSWVRDGSR